MENTKHVPLGGTLGKLLTSIFKISHAGAKKELVQQITDIQTTVM
jgi:hypothetical protein